MKLTRAQEERLASARVPMLKRQLTHDLAARYADFTELPSYVSHCVDLALALGHDREVHLVEMAEALVALRATYGLRDTSPHIAPLLVRGDAPHLHIERLRALCERLAVFVEDITDDITMRRLFGPPRPLRPPHE